MTEYRIETRFGYYARAERIAWANFARNDRASFEGATTFNSDAAARREIKYRRLENVNVIATK